MDNKNISNTGGRLLLVGLCLPFSMYAAADTSAQTLPAGVDISDWACEYCTFEHGYSGEIEAGIGYVTDPSFKFGEYNGLNDDGGYLIGNASARFRGDNAEYLNLRVRDLGLDTRSVDIAFGQQGRYSLFLNYDEIPHYISGSAQTPYLGTGSNVLVLPTGWSSSGTTTGMTDLAASLHDVDLKTARKRLGMGVLFIPAKHWETSVTVHHEIRDGIKAGAGTFYFNSAQLTLPVDSVTNQVEVSASYTTPKWQSRLAYYGSFFNNQDASLTWQNAYNPIVAGADTGQLALPPDNQFHQFQLSSAYQMSEGTRISGDIAVGRMKQNDELLAASINPNLVVALPRDSAEAQVNTLTANLKLDAAVNNKLRVKASYRYNDRNNKTPSTAFGWVSSDSFIAVARTNLPYSFTDKEARLGADYRVSNKSKITGGYDHVIKQRTNQEVGETTEGTFWAKASVRPRDNIDLGFKLAHSERDTSAYNLVAETDTPQNPLLRKYNLADRNRNSCSVRAGFIPHERVNLEVSVDYSMDDYMNSVMGLTESRETGYNVDASFVLTAVTTLHAFANREQIKSEQAGSQNFATPDWFAKNDDTIDTFGLGAQHQLIKDKLDVGLDYVVSRSTGDIRVVNAITGTDFPSLKTKLNSVQLHADYRLKDNMTLRVAYWYENYQSTDWTVDGVAPDTLSNVIGLGTDSPDYDLHTAMMSVRYRF